MSWVKDGWVEDGTTKKEKSEKKASNLGCVAIVLFPLVFVFGTMYYGGYRIFKEPNPLKWAETGRRIEEENKRRQELYRQALNLAADHDGRPGISFADMINLYKRMDENGPFYEEAGIGQFPTIDSLPSHSKPTIGQLEQAISSYEMKAEKN